MLTDKVRKNLKNKIKEVLLSHVTNREENPVPLESALHFLNENESKIIQITEEMIRDYTYDDELDELLCPEDDWIREYLYDFGLM